MAGAMVRVAGAEAMFVVGAVVMVPGGVAVGSQVAVSTVAGAAASTVAVRPLQPMRQQRTHLRPLRKRGMCVVGGLCSHI